jgi:hypothetical protein
MIRQITNVEDVATFAQHLVHVEKLSVHPDDDFADYTTYETRLPFYTEKEAERRNQLMNQCFDICEQNNIEIYEIFCNEMEHLLVK